MLHRTGLGVIALLALLAPANAQPRPQPGDVPRPRPAQRRTQPARARGTIARPRMLQPANPRTNPIHERVFQNPRTGREERHAVVIEQRPPAVISLDRRAVTAVPGYRPRYAWEHFHPRGGWASVWGVADWNLVGTVTCEAADEATGELYPVVASRDAIGWSDGAVDALLDQALDECAASVAAYTCVPTTPACTFQSY